jgi:tetratricopeptide (TPR) repeat protein
VRASLCLLVLLVTLPATAAEPAPDAKELYRRATAQYNIGHFKEAAEEYERVFEMHPDPVLLYNIAQAYRLAGGLEEKALFFYKSFLQRAPKAPNRAEVVGRIQDLEKVIEDRKLHPKPAEPVPMATPKPAEPKPAVAPAPASQPAVVTTRTERPTPIYKKWWLWTIVGGVVVAGVVVGVAVGVTSQAPEFIPNLPDGGPGSANGLTVRF